MGLPEIFKRYTEERGLLHSQILEKLNPTETLNIPFFAMRDNVMYYNPTSLKNLHDFEVYESLDLMITAYIHNLSLREKA